MMHRNPPVKSRNKPHDYAYGHTVYIIAQIAVYFYHILARKAEILAL